MPRSPRPRDRSVAGRPGKLIRDKIPDIVRSKGDVLDVSALTDAEMAPALDAKLLEEVEEFLGEPSIEEAADILEVLLARLERQGKTLEDLIQVRARKQEERGGFRKGVFLRF